MKKAIFLALMATAIYARATALPGSPGANLGAGQQVSSALDPRAN